MCTFLPDTNNNSYSASAQGVFLLAEYETVIQSHSLFIQASAMHSISISAPLGMLFTAKALRAGYGSLKNSA